MHKFVFIYFVFFLLLFTYTNVNVKADEDKNIVYLDPGHGGMDGGCNYKDLVEKDINLRISLKVKQILEEKGYTNFIMSQVTYIPDNYITLDEETTEKAINLIENLEDIDDVQAVYHNLDA